MYIGLDVHKKLSYYSMVDGKGTEVKRGRFQTTCEGLDEFASKLPEGAKVAIETSTSGIFAYEYLDERGIEVHLAHPFSSIVASIYPADKKDFRFLNSSSLSNSNRRTLSLSHGISKFD